MSKNIVYFAKRALASEGLTVCSSHLHEIYAAIVGYQSRAALGIPLEEVFKEIEILIPDKAGAVHRAHNLFGGATANAVKIVDILLEILTFEFVCGECTCSVYENLEDYYSPGYACLVDWIINHDSVVSEMALTNAWDFDCSDIVVDELETGRKTISFVADFSGESNPDKPYCGSRIIVEGEIAVGKYRNIADDFSLIKLIPKLEDYCDLN